MDLMPFKDIYKTKYLADEYERVSVQRDEAKSMLGVDPDMDALAADDMATLETAMKELVEKMEYIVKEEKVAEEKPREVILEVRAGVGGEEAAIFAEDLALMYQRFAAIKNW